MISKYEQEAAMLHNTVIRFFSHILFSHFSFFVFTCQLEDPIMACVIEPRKKYFGEKVVT